MAINTPAGKDSVYLQNPASAKCAISIASVTVAYNGAEVLQPHLDALKRQTQKIDEIVVVNNASTDDTLDLLAAKFPEVTVLNLSANGGVGGGFAVGLDYAAVTKKYDWVWLFDQDSVPAGDGLELLLAGLQHLNGDAASIAILAPVCAPLGTKMFCPGLLWKGGRRVPAPVDSAQPVTLVDLVISSGSLVRREAIEAVGLPRADFFMDFVDYEHCLRMRRHGFKIAVVRDSHLDHVLGDPSTFNILGHTAHWTDHAPWRVYYMTRNEVFTIWQYYSKWRNKVFLLCRLAWYLFALLLFGKRKLACLGMIYRGFLDGRAGRLGIRFLGTSR
jgi:rhamnosyltransferase